MSEEVKHSHMVLEGTYRTEVFANEGGGVSIAQPGEVAREDSIVSLSWQQARRVAAEISRLADQLEAAESNQ